MDIGDEVCFGWRGNVKSQDGYERTKYLVAGLGLEDPAQFFGSPKFGSTYPICSNMWYRNPCVFACSLNMFLVRPWKARVFWLGAAGFWVKQMILTNFRGWKELREIQQLQVQWPFWVKIVSCFCYITVHEFAWKKIRWEPKLPIQFFVHVFWSPLKKPSGYG